MEDYRSLFYVIIFAFSFIGDTTPQKQFEEVQLTSNHQDIIYVQIMILRKLVHLEINVITRI